MASEIALIRNEWTLPNANPLSTLIGTMTAT